MRSVSEFFMVIFLAVFGALFAKELRHADVSFVGKVVGSWQTAPPTRSFQPHAYSVYTHHY
jgi:hypothetical protein